MDEIRVAFPSKLVSTRAVMCEILCNHRATNAFRTQIFDAMGGCSIESPSNTKDVRGLIFW